MSAPPMILDHTVHAEGQDRTVVLLHSLALDRCVWDPIVPHLTPRRTVVTVDLRGHGASPPDSGFTVHDMAADVARTLEHLGIERSGVVGLSMGGCVAQAFATAYPERIDALGLVDTTAWYGPDAPETWAGRAEKARSEGMRSLSEFQLDRWFSEGFLERNPDLGRDLLERFAANDLESYVSSCLALGSVDLREEVRDIRVPTVVVVGENDPATSPDHAADLRDRIPGARMHVLAEAKHLTALERPEEVSEHLLSVLA